MEPRRSPMPAIRLRRSLRLRRRLFLLVPLIFSHVILPTASAVEILSKSKLERCAKDSETHKLDCDKKVVISMAVPSGSSGGEASIVAELVEVEENDTQKMKNVRNPPVITINKSAAYALYELTYIRDVAYKPEEYYVKTRKCERNAGANVVKICESLRDKNDHVIEHTQPTCCPCGPQRRVPSSCGNFFDKIMKGKANTAHCLRFPGDWFHVFSIGRRSLGFSVQIEVRKGSLSSEVIVGPENRTALSKDNFLRVNLIGDFVGYTSIPSFEDFYLITPRIDSADQPQNLGTNFSRWMLLERVRFTLDGLECNKIGVSYEAYNGQPNFCSSPLWSCLHNQLWHFWEADQNRINRNQPPQYVLQGRFERINQHPNAGPHTFSVGITEVLNTNLLIELNADDIEYVYQRSPGKIISINIPTFEALNQFGTATITTKNVGDLEASYSLTFACLKGVSFMEEQFFIMKPEEVVTRSFYLYPTTDQAAEYACTAILKASDFSEVDRAECQFTTTATILDNGSQIVPAYDPEKKRKNGFFEAIGSMWGTIWNSVIDFFTSKTCSCHMQYICISWILMLGLLLAIFPTVIILLWLLHQKGLFDPVYDWWEDRFGTGTHGRRIHSECGKEIRQPHTRSEDHGYHVPHKSSHYHSHAQNKRRCSHSRHVRHGYGYPEHAVSDHHHHKHDHSHVHVHKTRLKHKQGKSIVDPQESRRLNISRPLPRGGSLHEEKHKRHMHGHSRILDT